MAGRLLAARENKESERAALSAGEMEFCLDESLDRSVGMGEE